jgi:hypothetical protein
MSSADGVVLTRESAPRAIVARQIMPAVRAGEVVVVPRGLQRVGYFDEIVETTLAAVQDSCGDATADACLRLGFERLHEVMDEGQIERSVHAVDRRLAALYARLMKALGHGVFGIGHSFYIHRCPLMRFMVPSGVSSTNVALFHRKENRGHLSGHGPHRDYWFFNPVNSINVWMAIGAVDRENGLLVYTDMWGKPVTRGQVFAAEGQDFGTPLTFSLEPGDVAVFDNRQLHATAVNVSSSTRVVFSGRICPELPIPPRADALEHVTFWSPLIGTPFEGFAGAAAKVSPVYALERLKRRTSRTVAAIEQRVGGSTLRALREALRYRRGDRVFDA